MDTNNKLENNDVEKTSGFNPALLVDDVIDAYIQVNAAKRRLADEQRRKQRPKPLVQPIKKAGLEEYVDRYAESIVNNPKMLIPSPKVLAAIGLGLGSSMYGPEWAFGPSEEDIDNGKRFNPSRAAKATLGIGVVGTGIASVPIHAYDALTAQTDSRRIAQTAMAIPGVLAAKDVYDSFSNGEVPNPKRILKRYGKARIGALAAGFTGAMAANPKVREAIKNAINAAKAKY